MSLRDLWSEPTTPWKRLGRLTIVLPLAGPLFALSKASDSAPWWALLAGFAIVQLCIVLWEFSTARTAEKDRQHWQRLLDSVPPERYPR